jgi:RNA polymerase sigma-70 factor (ECF subfamily)
MIGIAHSAGAETDVSLIRRLRDGDTAALEVLMARYTDRVYRLASGVTGSSADAEEVVQDVFLTLFRKAHTFEERAALSSWIYRITLNAALIKRRGGRGQREVSLEALLPTFLPDGHRAGEPAVLRTDWSQTAESELLAKETREILHQAIQDLPDSYRTVVILRDVEGLSSEQVAEVVGDSVPAVKSRLHRARMALREALTRHLGPRPGSRAEMPPAGHREPEPRPDRILPLARLAGGGKGRPPISVTLPA